MRKDKLLHFPSSIPLDKICLFCLCLFVLLFPKGGIKIDDIPITWGYLLLALVGMALLFRKKFSLNKKRSLCLLALLPFQLLSLTTLIFFGFISFNNTFAFLISFYALPTLFFAIFSQSINHIDTSFFLKILKNGLFFLAVFGIFLFIFKLVTGKFFEIPLLSVNLQDFGAIEEKSIDRGTAFKLISTYNNGNIYGICLLLTLPMYGWIEDKWWKKFVVIISLLLTLSRTVWIGLFFSYFLQLLFLRKRFNKFFLLGFFSLALFLVAKYFGFTSAFFLDATLGGREDQLEVLHKITFFPENRFIGIYEIVYLAILENFGLLGLFFFLLALLAPIGTFFLERQGRVSSLDKCLLIGLISYLFVCFSDGAILYIPTMAFYWFIASFLQKHRDVDVKNSSLLASSD